jgi:Lon protease-like protein
MMQDLPLFPLQSVLFPGGELGLQIFEVRYLDMIGRAWKTGQPFGVVGLTQGTEVRQRAREADSAAFSEAFATEHFYNVGTLAHILELERPQAGLIMIRCQGGQRFTLSASHQLPHGLWVGQATLLPADAAVSVPPHLLGVKTALQTVAQRWPDAQPQDWDNAAWLANRCAELLPMPSATRQQLMALDNPLLRLELVADILESLQKK